MQKLKIYDNCTPGLGNQLFQYAAGLYFEKECDGSLLLLAPAEKHCRSGGHPRPFQLDKFRVQRDTLPASFYRRFIQTRIKSLVVPPVRKALAMATHSYRIDESLPLSRFQNLDLPPDASSIYLWGYWQSWQYAAAVESTLRHDLQLKNEPTARNLEYAQQIVNSVNTVSIHLRRGDYTVYTTGSGSTRRGLVLEMCYYERAIEWMRERLGTVTFVVFSDDQAFARQAIQEPGTIYVEGNDAHTAYEDLRLMSLCQHHIIANSSFSWWGAWRNPSKTKLVAAPEYWTNQEDTHFPDLIPPEWTKIPNL